MRRWSVAGGLLCVAPGRAESSRQWGTGSARRTAQPLVSADPEKVIGIAGVMGGAASEVSDATTAVIIESAVFDAVSVRRTAHRYALRSEARQRFEKGPEHRPAPLG